MTMFGGGDSQAGTSTLRAARCAGDCLLVGNPVRLGVAANPALASMHLHTR